MNELTDYIDAVNMLTMNETLLESNTSFDFKSVRTHKSSLEKFLKDSEKILVSKVRPYSK